MRVIVAGWIRFASAEIAGKAIRAGADLIAESRTETGCVAYNWSVDPLDDGKAHVFEEWESEQDLLRHLRHRSYTQMRDQLAQHELSDFDIKLYSVAGIEPVYDEEGQARTTIFGVSL